jgi:hypothetical protein
MDNPREDTSIDQFLTRGAFTIAGVRADPDTKGLETAFATVHAELKAKGRHIEDLEETLEEHEAVIVVRDRAVDKLVRSLELRVLDLVDKNRDDPRYRRYFPHGVRAVTEADARTVEPKMVRDLIKTLDEDQNKAGFDALYVEFRSRLQSAVEVVEAADNACAQVETQWAFERDKLLAEIKLKWVEERKKLHAEITKLFPHDATRVESYFRRFAKPRKKKAE